jgi:hypothetical protein
MMDYLTSSEELEMFLTIPNNVDSTYTGVIEASLSLTFYMSDTAKGVENIHNNPIITPLTNAPGYSPNTPTTVYPWNRMQVSGDDELTYDISADTFSRKKSVATGESAPEKGTAELDLAALVIPYDTLVLEVFASGHGCEEFYYGNIPDGNFNISADMQLCRGGVYREVQVYIDGVFAGAVYPFPVIYSGGVNPILWRPLAGIESFDIEPLKFDLSPFLGTIFDGDKHNISITVYGNNPTGLWYLDANLLGYNSNPKSQIVKATKPVVADSGAQVSYTREGEGVIGEEGVSVAFNTTGRHIYTIESDFTLSDGTVFVRKVSGSLYDWNHNAFKGELAYVQMSKHTFVHSYLHTNLQ